MTRIGSWPLAALAITASVVLTFWSGNILRLGFENVWPTLLITVGLSALLVLALRLVARSWTRAGLGAAICVIYVFYARSVVELIGLPFIAAIAVHVAIILGLALLYRKLPREDDRLVSIAGRVNLVGLILLAFVAVPLAVEVVQLERARTSASASFEELSGKAAADSPDVWHIIFDRYASSQTLRDQYAFDNSPFLGALEARGFRVAQSAYSNYQRTAHSVASTMNGTLLDPLSQEMNGQQSDWVPIYRSMRDGAAIRQFDRMGYETIFAGSWWEPTRFSETASESIQIRALPQLAQVVLENSALGFWLQGSKLPWLDGRNDQCFRATEKFRHLTEITTRTENKLVFAHFLVPHPPFVVGADGSCKSLDNAVASSRRDNYVAQIQFANAKVLQLIDAIMAGPRPAAIVLHSDEGPWPEPYVGYEHGLGTDPVPVPWTDLSPEQTEEKFGILMAMRTPDGSAPTTMPSSPVQIYPAMLRDYFGSDGALPQSTHSVFRDDDALYDFVDIGTRLNTKD